MHKTQLAAALVAVLGLAISGPALAADNGNEISAKKVNLADEKSAEKPATEKKAKKSHKKAKGKESSCKGKEGSCKSKEGGETKSEGEAK